MAEEMLSPKVNAHCPCRLGPPKAANNLGNQCKLLCRHPICRAGAQPFLKSRPLHHVQNEVLTITAEAVGHKYHLCLPGHKGGCSFSGNYLKGVE